ncbi:pseudouridine synthase [Pelistega sp. MC2]|uniref:pseudouridine synthase n=1 Tax=Pelistega sp. MC2 TaxID=1720297 RepID=UPI0008DAE4D1|nr:pseudouridine synthase [Pelistega sp. MC2]
MQKNPLPVKQGITASRLYLPKGQWHTLFDFLVERFPHMSKEILLERLRKGDILDSNGLAYQENSPYPAESWLWYYREVEKEVVVPFDMPILYQDEYLIAVDKPHFLASVPGGRYLQETALIRLRTQLNNYDISPIHRLDRDTAGVLIFCVNPIYRGKYQSLFQSKMVKKIYECIAPFSELLRFPLIRESYIEKSSSYFTMQEKQLDNNLFNNNWNSRTEIELIHHNDYFAHYRLKPHTGKKHQLRVHMNGLGLPILNDEFYPDLLPARKEDDFSNPLQLLAKSIEFIDPITGNQRFFESRQTLNGLELFK